VDLRRWRQERERQLRQAEAELAVGPAPGRITWPFRILALIGGIGFLVFGTFLASFPWLIRIGGGPSWSVFELLLLLVGGAIALFGVDLIGRGFRGRELRDTIPRGSFSRRGGR
jgi:hypothetical protein